MTYVPKDPSTLKTFEELRDWVQDELGFVSQEFGSTNTLWLNPVARPPDKPREGMFLYADGTNFDPGSGKGTYEYDGTNWIKQGPLADMSTFELLNDGPTFLAVLCPLTVYGGGTIAKGVLRFEPKISSSWTLNFVSAANFHILDSVGAPATPTSITDDGHHTTKSGWISVGLPGGTGLVDLDMTWLVADDVPGNAVTITVP